MSKGYCSLCKNTIKQALDILESGNAGQGKGISMALTHLEDAVLRIDYHMRQEGWIETPAAANGAVPVKQQMLPPGSIMPAPTAKINPTPRPSTLVPAPTIPKLNTGLMNTIPVPAKRGRPPKSIDQDIEEDISLLG